MNDNVVYLNLPPELGAMMRLFEDDVTPSNVEQYISAYLEKLQAQFTPEEIAVLEPFRASFLDAVRSFAAYEVGGRGKVR